MQPTAGPEEEALAQVEGEIDEDAVVVHDYDYTFDDDDDLYALDEDELADLLAEGNPIEIIPESIRSEEDLEDLITLADESDKEDEEDDEEVGGSDTNAGYLEDEQESNSDSAEPTS